MGPYEFGFIDAQYLIRRNSSKLYSQNDGIVNWQSIAISVLQSILTLKSYLNVKKIILLWDLGPYRKLEVIKDYKGDRGHIYDIDIKSLEIEFSKSPTPELKEEIENLKYDLEQEHEFDKAKDFIISKFGKIFPSLIKPGLEADDFAVMLTLLPEVKHSILATSDSDWMYMITENLDLYRMIKNPVIYNYEKLKEEWELDWWYNFIGQKFHLLHYKLCYDIYYGNHDNVFGIKSKCKKVTSPRIIPFEEFFKDLSSNNVSSYTPYIRNHVIRYYNALNSRRYLPEFKNIF